MPRAAIAAVRRRDPVARTGLAICLGLAVLVGAAGWLWWRATNEPRVHLTLFFPTTVHGVDVGSPVKIQGIPVGHIESMGVRLPTEGDEASYAEVKVVLDGDLIATKGLPRRLDARRNLRAEIERGLRARLRLISPMHGTLYVELTYEPEAAPRFVARPDEALAEVPTLPDPLTRGLLAAGHRFVELEKLDFAAMEAELLERLDRLAADIDPESIGAANDAVERKLDAVKAAMDDPALRAKLAAVNADLAAVRKAMAEVDGRTGRGVTQLMAAAARLRGDLAEAAEQAERLGRAVDPGAAALAPVYARLIRVRDDAARVAGLCELLTRANGLASILLKASAGPPAEPDSK